MGHGAEVKDSVHDNSIDLFSARTTRKRKAIGCYYGFLVHENLTKGWYKTNTDGKGVIQMMPKTL